MKISNWTVQRIDWGQRSAWGPSLGRGIWDRRGLRGRWELQDLCLSHRRRASETPWKFYQFLSVHFFAGQNLFGTGPNFIRASRGPFPIPPVGHLQPRILILWDTQTCLFIWWIIFIDYGFIFYQSVSACKYVHWRLESVYTFYFSLALPTLGVPT